MLVGRNAEGAVVVMADDRGLERPAMRAAGGEWRVDVPPPEELHEFVAVEDEIEREALLEEARAFLASQADGDVPLAASLSTSA
jgi:hypothetical protein